MAKNENILTWNFENMFSVVLMAAIGFGLLAVGQSLWQKKMVGKAA